MGSLSLRNRSRAGLRGSMEGNGCKCPDSRLTRPKELTVNRAIHRGDYQYVGPFLNSYLPVVDVLSRSVLLEEAVRLGVHVVTNAKVVSLETSSDSDQTVCLKDGRQIHADAVIGADGLWSCVPTVAAPLGKSCTNGVDDSVVRETVLQRKFEPLETGDLGTRSVLKQRYPSYHSLTRRSTPHQPTV